MKSFHQFYEQAAVVAPAPTPAAPKVAKAQPKAKPKVTDPSTGVDIDDKGRWQGDIVDQGKELEPEKKVKIKDGIKGADPNIPSGEANPNKKKRDDLDALMNKAPGTHTAAEKQRLIDAGLDDFVRGGRTQATGVDAAGLGLAAAGGAALGLSGATAGVGLGVSRLGKGAKNWYNQGRNVRVPNENSASWKALRADDKAQIGKFVNPKNPTNPDGSVRLTGGALPNPTKGYQVKQFVTGQGGATRSFNPFLGPGQGLRSGPTPLGRQQVERPVRAVVKALKGLKK